VGEMRLFCVKGGERPDQMKTRMTMTMTTTRMTMMTMMTRMTMRTTMGNGM
jgi:hypothetical protein